MTLVIQRELSEEELALGIVLIDPYLFRLHFFSDDLTKEPSLEQKLMFCDQSEKMLLCTARKVAKTISVEATVLQDILLNEREKGGIDEALFVTPGDVHMQQFVDRLFARINGNAVFKNLIKIRRGDNMMLESDNLRYYFRVEGLSGTDRNMTGLRAKYVRGDEMAYGNFACHNSRIQTALPGAKFLYAGVPNGVRDTPFFHLDQRWEGRKWSRHNYPSFINPLYQSEKRRIELIEDYGGKNTQGYINNVLGEWGEEVVSSFPPGSIAIREVPYFFTRLSGFEASEEIRDVALKIHIPAVRCKRFAIGFDYGYSPDPATLFGAYQKDGNEDTWQVYARIEMWRVALPHQVSVALHLIQRVFEGEFAGLVSDHIGAVQALQDRDKNNSRKYIWSVPAGATAVELHPPRKKDEEGFDLSDPIQEESVDTAKIRNKQYFTDRLKEWMINAAENLSGRKLWLGHDEEVEEELVGTTERRTTAGYTIYYGPKHPNIKGGMKDHNREALQYLCQAIEEGLKIQYAEDETDDVLGVLGWAASPFGEEEWKAPWDRT
jgi:hypothetical protein